MTLPIRVRALVPAALLALALAGVSATQADARPKHPDDNGVRCSLPGATVGSSNAFEFYAPGTSVYVTDSEGHEYELMCGPDGNWVTTPLSIVARPPRLVSGGGVAQR